MNPFGEPNVQFPSLPPPSKVSTKVVWASVAGVFKGLGTGGFGAPSYYEVGEDTRSVALGDLNTDGRPDLIAANGGEMNRVTVLLNVSESTAEPVPGLLTPVLPALAGLLLAMGHLFSRRDARIRPIRSRNPSAGAERQTRAGTAARYVASR